MKKGDLVKLNAKARRMFPKQKDTGPWPILSVDEFYERIAVQRTSKSDRKRREYWSMFLLELVEEGDAHE